MPSRCGGVSAAATGGMKARYARFEPSFAVYTRGVGTVCFFRFRPCGKCIPGVYYAMNKN